MVSIFTYRDERKLFAVIAATIVAAIVALAQIGAARSGKSSPVEIVVSSAALIVQETATDVAAAVTHAVTAVVEVPRYYATTQALTAENQALRQQDARLRETVSHIPDALALEQLHARVPRGIAARAIALDLEGQSRMATIDRGSLAGIKVDDGVIDADGAVGRVVSVDPLTSKVLLLIDPGSKVPAVVQRGRWWGIATGTNTRVRLQYVSQDASLRIGDRIVTGSGESFTAGVVIGRITNIYHPEGALYQTALVEPAAAFGRLGGVLVIPK
ncbi:MAG: rod shape-determining protein MreC [Vulcanimicrobiaceae bacterium]